MYACIEADNSQQQWGSCDHAEYDHDDMIHYFDGIPGSADIRDNVHPPRQPWCGECDASSGGQPYHPIIGWCGGEVEGLAQLMIQVDEAVRSDGAELQDLVRQHTRHLIVNAQAGALALLDCRGVPARVFPLSAGRLATLSE
jgi:hypothetical protein